MPVNDIRKFYSNKGINEGQRVLIDFACNMNTYASSVNGVVLNSLTPFRTPLYCILNGEVTIPSSAEIIGPPPVEDNDDDNE